VLLQISDPAFVRMIRLKTFDIYQQISPRLDGDYPVYVIDVDEKSLAEIGQWPWPRTVMAELVEKAFEQQVAGLAFDMVFAETDRLSVENIKGMWDLDEATKDGLSKIQPNDIIFAKTIQKYPVVVGHIFDDTGEKEEDFDFIPKSPILSLTDTPISTHVQHATGAIRNLPNIEYRAQGAGHFIFAADVDNISRRVPMIVQYKDEFFPSLSLELLRVAMNVEDITVNATPEGIQDITVGDVIIPTDGEGNYLVHFRHHNMDRYVSAVDVLNGTLPEGTLAGKLVFIGTSAMGLLDLRSTPLDSAKAGVDVHMQVVETIMDGDSLHRPVWFKRAEILFVLLMGFFMMLFMEKQSAVKSFVFAIFVLTGTLGGCVWVFIEYGLLIDVGLPLIALGVVFTMHNFVKYAKEEAAKKEIRNAFGHYLSSDMVNILTENTDSLILGGTEKELTILFSDIRSFTTISEGLGPDELTTFINEYLTPMTDSIMNHEGTIDKYMGDAIMAFWNAPLDIKDHTYQCCSSALEQMKMLEELNVGWAQKGLPPIKIGIGINTGLACVGNMGSTQRFDYTVLGDSINLAARLESSSKMYGVDIVVSQYVKDVIGSRGVFMPIDLVIVKGKTEPVATYALLGLEEATDEAKANATIMEDFMELYKARQWLKAKKKLAELPQEHEVLKKLYEDRMASYRKSPPPKNWDGSYVATSK
jgi:adenylate cyclase